MDVQVANGAVEAEPVHNELEHDELDTAPPLSPSAAGSAAAGGGPHAPHVVGQRQQDCGVDDIDLPALSLADPPPILIDLAIRGLCDSWAGVKPVLMARTSEVLGAFGRCRASSVVVAAVQANKVQAGPVQPTADADGVVVMQARDGSPGSSGGSGGSGGGQGSGDDRSVSGSGGGSVCSASKRDGRDVGGDRPAGTASATASDVSARWVSAPEQSGADGEGSCSTKQTLERADKANAGSPDGAFIGPRKPASSSDTAGAASAAGATLSPPRVRPTSPPRPLSPCHSPAPPTVSSVAAASPRPRACDTADPSKDVLQRLAEFQGPPLTLQRLAELLCRPELEYKSNEKLCRALLRLVMVPAASVEQGKAASAEHGPDVSANSMPPVASPTACVPNAAKRKRLDAVDEDPRGNDGEQDCGDDSSKPAGTKMARTDTDGTASKTVASAASKA